MIVPGSRLGPYEIIAPAGAGGMGEVYKARDTRLERTVAIKVLSADFASDLSLKQRFDREAKSIASLSHPHICPLFDIGHQDGTDFLVMEFLEGETLESRLKKGALPLDLALEIAIQVADALAAAERAGIVHRDVKPGNIMLTTSGAKLLDFGLAKTGLPAGVGTLSMLPTTPPSLTASGSILGTFQYMAPEQLEGQEADHRTDIFALGVVIYEMVSGRKAFEGKSQASLIAAILERPVSPLSHAALARVVDACLAKPRHDRWQSAADLARELRWIAAGSAPSSGRATTAGWRGVRLGLATVAVALLAFVIGMLVNGAPADPVRPVARLQLPLPPNTTVTAVGLFSLSPDGKTVAYRATVAGGPIQLLVHALDSVAVQQVSVNGDIKAMFWSPDSSTLGYVSGGTLRAYDRLTHSSRQIAALPPSYGTSGEPLGGAWGADGTILLGANRLSSPGGLIRIMANGGEWTPLTLPGDDAIDVQPSFIDRSQRLVFARVGKGQGTYITDLNRNEPRRITTDYMEPQVASGVLFFGRGTSLLAQRMASDGSLNGEPITVADGVASNPLTGRVGYAVSEHGPLVYSSAFVVGSQLTWVSASGAILGTVGEPGPLSTLKMSRDGARVIFAVRDPANGVQNLWSADLQRGASSRITFGPNRDSDGAWSPDGSLVAYASMRDRNKSIYIAPALGGAERLIVKADPEQRSLDDWSPDGQWLLYHIDGRGEMWAQSLASESPPSLVARAGQGRPDEGMFSPDGKWVAYNSDESGRSEVYLVPFPATGMRWQVTTQGGMQPKWRGDGQAIFYLGRDGTMNRVDLRLRDVPVIGATTPLFKTDVVTSSTVDQYVVTPDGSRFLIMKPTGKDAEPPPTVLMNWHSLLSVPEAPRP
jgi:eukaryotic-like serine/threonine-protein kinase